MRAPTLDHPTPDELASFGQGRLDHARATVIEEHVASCDSCCETLRRVPDDTLIGHLRQAETATFFEPSASVPAVEEVPAELRDHPRYQVVKLLGKGGMGVVYKAEHRMMERHVALKVINKKLIRSQNALERFHREVKAAARLSHPAIVTAYDADQAGALQILVMEFVDGISIARQVEKVGPMAVRHACQCARQAAIGLEHAHTKGMIHRDIKPQNLMLTRDGRVKILDFGLARYAREADLPVADTPHAAPDDDRLTRDGATLGTPDYIAPEQVGGAATVDIRADIYSLGCTLYFLLVGHPPFPRGTTAEKLLAHVEREPTDLGSLRPDVPPGLVSIVNRMMAKNPADRFATPAQVAEALAAFTKWPAVPSADAAAAPSDAPERVESLEMAFSGISGVSGKAKKRTKPRKSAGRAVTAIALGTGLLLACVGGWIALGGMRPNSPGLREQAARNLPQATRDSNPLGGSRASAVPRLVSRSLTPPAAECEVDKPRASGVPMPSARHKKRILVVVPHEDFWIPDVANLRRAADSIGVKVAIASSERSPARPSKSGPSSVPQHVDLLLSEANPDDFDTIIFTGAHPSESLEHVRDPIYADAARKIIKGFEAQEKPIASICMGSRVLADLGFLKDRDAARCPYQPTGDDYQAKAHWKDQAVASDGLFVTAKDQDAAKLLVLKIVDKLK